MVMIRHFSELLDPKKPSRKGWTVRVLPPEEAARARAEHLREQNAHRLPPEAYTRFLLQAKDGQISGDEATRRILKYGGSTGIRPIKKR